jgi:hypothetical protein
LATLSSATPPLLAAVGAVSVGFVAAYVALSSLVRDTQIAGGLAGLVLMAGPTLHREFQRYSPTRPSLQRDAFPTFQASLLPAWQLFSGSLVVLSAAVAAGRIAPIALGPISSVSPVVGTVATIAAPAVAYAVGTWIGARARGRDMVLAAVVAAAAFAVGTILAGILMQGMAAGVVPADTSPCAISFGTSPITPGPGSGPNDGPPLIAPPGGAASPGASSDEPGGRDEVPPDPRSLYGSCAVQAVLDNTLALLEVFVLTGCWRGRASRDARYLSRLLRQLTPETRNVIVDLAFEEARAREAGVRRSGSDGVERPPPRERRPSS